MGVLHGFEGAEDHFVDEEGWAIEGCDFDSEPLFDTKVCRLPSDFFVEPDEPTGYPSDGDLFAFGG